MRGCVLGLNLPGSAVVQVPGAALASAVMEQSPVRSPAAEAVPTSLNFISGGTKTCGVQPCSCCCRPGCWEAENASC